jgi:NADP-dependent 3-hydroxy acid dehydrogenase YdfG
VVLAARRKELVDELARAVATYLSRAEDVESLATIAVAEFRRLDVWINNAGVDATGSCERVVLADHVEVIQTDLLGTLYGC